MTTTDDDAPAEVSTADPVAAGEVTADGGGRRRTSPLAVVLLAPIRVYQLVISPWLPRSCRFYPSCSAYAVTALRERGAVVGTVLAIYRVLRCNPWARGGVDHVPHRGERWPSWDGVVDHRVIP